MSSSCFRGLLQVSRVAEGSRLHGLPLERTGRGGPLEDRRRVCGGRPSRAARRLFSRGRRAPRVGRILWPGTGTPRSVLQRGRAPEREDAHFRRTRSHLRSTSPLWRLPARQACHRLSRELRRAARFGEQRWHVQPWLSRMGSRRFAEGRIRRYGIPADGTARLVQPRRAHSWFVLGQATSLTAT